MNTTERIVERLPRFYGARETSSNIYQFCNSFAEEFEEAKRNLFKIMRAHWIESCEGKDLEELAKIFSFFKSPDESDLDFRNEVFKLIDFCLSTPGGGTRESLLKWLALYLRLDHDSNESKPNDINHSEIQIIEYPERLQKMELDAVSDFEWRVDSKSIEDEEFSLTFVVGENGHEVQYPEIIVLDIDSSVTVTRIKYNDILRSGQRLVIKENGYTEVDDVDVTSNMVFSGERKILRRPTTWKYKESTSPKVGRFDGAKFDESFFQVDVPTISIRMEWKARLRATVEIIISPEALSRGRVSKNDIQQLFNHFYKSAGVNLIVKNKGDSR
jgi:hypothetical protein